MTDPARRGVKEGIAFGIIAGLLFAAGMMIEAALTGGAITTPLRFASSVLLGEQALYSASGVPLVVGLLVHVLLSALFGLFYGLVNASFTSRTQTTWSRQLMLGAIFGAVIWFVNFQIIGRVAFEWFLKLPQGVYLLLHAFAFGLPLALMYAAAERRVQHVRVKHA